MYEQYQYIILATIYYGEVLPKLCLSTVQYMGGDELILFSRHAGYCIRTTYCITLAAERATEHGLGWRLRSSLKVFSIQSTEYCIRETSDGKAFSIRNGCSELMFDYIEDESQR